VLDLHCHILPGIDDGARDIDETLAMLQIAQYDGILNVVATPHVIEGKLPTWQDIVNSCEAVKEAAQAKGIEIPIYPGAEVFLNWDILDKITGPGPFCINGGNYMLVELPAAEIPRFTEEFFFTLQTRGITPILAHPERHPELIRRPQILANWIEKGVLTQMNGPSLKGGFGEKVMQMAELMLVNNMVHCIGSDAHGIRSRRPELSGAADKVESLVGKIKAQIILQDNPKMILRSEEVQGFEVHKVKAPRESLGLSAWLANILK
jgi:protein-tyrosine phosphatase